MKCFKYHSKLEWLWLYRHKHASLARPSSRRKKKSFYRFPPETSPSFLRMIRWKNFRLKKGNKKQMLFGWYKKIQKITKRCHNWQNDTIIFYKVPKDTIIFHKVPRDTIVFHKVHNDTIKFYKVPTDTIIFHKLPKDTIILHKVPRDIIIFL